MPHEAKLEAGKIEITLQEKQKVRTTPSAHNYRDWPDAQDGWWVTERLIDVQVFRCPPGSRQSDADTGNDKIQASFKFKLPPNLTRCRQTVDHHPSINFKHSLHYTIDIINPDGHVSQLKTHHNVRIFISPHLPIGPRNEVSSIPQGELMVSIREWDVGYFTRQLSEALALEVFEPHTCNIAQGNPKPQIPPVQTGLLFSNPYKKHRRHTAATLSTPSLTAYPSLATRPLLLPVNL